MTVKVFVLDDHELVRRGIVDLLGAYDDLEVVGEAATGDEAMQRIAGTEADVALLDVRLGEPNRTGIEVCRDLRSAYPHLVCLMLTSYSDDDALVASVLAGASGYLLKQIRGPELVDSIRRAAEGASLLEAAVVQMVVDRLRAPAVDPLDALSGQERRILDLIAQGLTNRQIGEELFLAEKTVKNYVSNVLAKLGMSRRTEAAAFRARLDTQLRHGEMS